MRSPDRLRRNWAQRLLIVMNVWLILSCIGIAWVLELSWQKASSVTRVQLATSLTPPAPEEGGARVVNLLLVGSDSSLGLGTDDPVQNGRKSERNGDVIIIAHLDERDGTAALLSFPRDLWVTIADTEREAKINSAFATGGPAGLIDTLEQNFDIPINYYVNVDFAGFEGLVDAVGSVDVYFAEPARDWNPQTRATQTGFEMLTPGCQTLDPQMALSYVRSRYYQTMINGRWVTDPRGDLGRIRRQQEFLQRLASRAIDLGARNPFVLSDLIDATLDHVSIDQQLTPQLLLDLGRTYGSFEPGSLDTYTFPTQSGMVGAASAELPLEEQAEPVLALFRGASSTDPSTIAVEVVSARDQVEAADDLVLGLEREGFTVDQDTANDLDGGITVFHGPDGASAAAVLAGALKDQLGYVVPARPLPAEALRPLAGRSVRVSIGAIETFIPEFPLSDGGTVDEGATSPTVVTPEVEGTGPDAGCS